jgi:hypothetical protein
MNPTLAGVALAVTVGAVIAASAREARAALIGLALALGLGPFLADPLQGPAVLGARVVTGILVVYLLWAVSSRADAPGLGSKVGWPAETMLAVAAMIAGVAIAGNLASLQPGAAGPAQSPLDALTSSALTLAAGLAAIVIGLAPAFLARTTLRTVIGLLLVLQGIVLARIGIAGQPGELEQLGVDGLVVAVGAAGALLATLEAHGAPDASARHPAAPDAR